MRDPSEVITSVVAEMRLYADDDPYAGKLHRMTHRWADRLEAASTPPGDAVAWATHHEPPMLFPTQAEAAAYCDDDERPIALYTTPQPAAAEVDDAMVERIAAAIRAIRNPNCVSDVACVAFAEAALAAIKGDSHAG